MSRSLDRRDPVRAAIVGTGLLAQHLYEYSSQDKVEIVAIGSTSPGKVGALASELFEVEGPELRVESTESLLERDDVDVLLHAGPQATVWDIFEASAMRGLDAITTAGAYSLSDDPEQRVQEEATVETARRTGARLLGTGIFPGFTPDVLPIALASTLPGPVDITVRLISDIGTWSENVLRNEIGVGSAPRKPDIALFNYVKASARLIADSIQSEGTEWEHRSEYLIAEEATAIGPVEVPAGYIGGFSLRSSAKLVMSRVSVTWESMLGGTQPGGEIVIANRDRDLSITARLTGTPAYPATAARMLNSVRPLRTLEPGLRQAFEVPFGFPSRGAS